MTGPRVFGLPHLSEDAVAAFADGVLSAAAASRARRHCGECVECADAVRGQRETAMMLRTAAAPPLPSGLLDRLAGVPMSAPLPPRRGGLPVVLGDDGIAMFLAHDARNAGSRRDGADRTGQPHPDQPHPDQQHAGHPAHRRGALPMSMLASAAAVVAAGTLGGHVSTLAAGAQPAPAAANVAAVSTRSAGAAGRPGAGSSLPGGLAAIPALTAALDRSPNTLAVAGSGRALDGVPRPALPPIARLATAENVVSAFRPAAARRDALSASRSAASAGRSVQPRPPVAGPAHGPAAATP